MTRRRFAIRVEERQDAEPAAVVHDGLRAYNRQQMGPYEAAKFAVYVKDGDGLIVGGCLAETLWGWLYIDNLWLDEGLRRRGWGTRLLDAAERVGRDRGCHDAWLDTFSFQARGFYERCGYEVFGTLEDYPVGTTRYWMRKKLVRSARKRAPVRRR